MRLLDVLNQPWAILPEKLLEIREIYLRRAHGEKLDLEALEARLGRAANNQHQPYEIIEGVAVIPVEGIIAKRMNLFTQISGGVSTELLAADFKAALADPAVHSILLDMDSPGGQVDGTQELAAMIYQARTRKPIATLGSSTLASSAYWIGSAAERVFISSETTQVGSIGVLATHLDFSKHDEQAGVKVTEITAGKYKRLASRHAPLSDEARSDLQSMVDQIYTVFVNQVAAQRGVNPDRVLSDMADGKLFLGSRAIDAGLVDGFATRDGLIALLNKEKLSAPSSIPHSGAKGGRNMAEKSGVQIEVIGPEEMTKRETAAYDRGKAEGNTEGLTQGAAAERERIRAIEGAGLPGHEALIQELKFDGKTTGPEASQRVVAAEKQKQADTLARMRTDAPKPVPAAVAPQAPAQAEDSLPLEDRCKLDWERKPEVREEFTSLAGYTAFRKAEAAGRVRILSRASQ